MIGRGFWDYLWKLAFRQDVRDVGFVEGCEGDVSDGEYHWYDVLTWVPAPDEYFWMGPGRFTPDGKTAINGVYLDKIKFTRVE